VSGDAAVAAKALNDAARTMHTLEFKGGFMDRAALSADDVRAIARLPAREVLHAQLVWTIAAPLSGLVRGLNALIAGLAIQLQQIAEKGLVSGEAPAPAAPEPEAAAAEPQPEAAAEPEPEPAAAAEPEPEPEPEAAAAEPEPEAAAEPEPEAAPQETEQESPSDDQPSDA